jgi:hypothetical protein
VSDDPTPTRPSEAERRRVTVSAVVRLGDSPTAVVQTTADGTGTISLGGGDAQIIGRVRGLAVLGRAVEQLLADLVSGGPEGSRFL